MKVAAPTGDAGADRHARGMGMGPRAGATVVALALGLAATACGSSSTDVEGGGGGGGGPQVFQAPTATTYPTTSGSIHMACHGSGTLPVVFLAGGNDPGSIWDGIVASLGPDVLACTFDRPGVAPSYQPAAALAPQDVADALAETLPQANIGSRFVLVGHSLGGLVLRVFGGSQSATIAGAVFVDATVPSFATGAAAGELQTLGFDPPATQSQGDAVTSWSSDVTITVLSHDPALALTTGWSAADQAAWTAGQDVYAALTPHGTQTDVTGASHYIFVDAPEVVVSAIQQLLP